MSYSPLVSYYVKSPNYDPRGSHTVKGFAIHCFPGQITVKRGVDAFSYPRDASANYVVGYDGKIGCAVDDENRSWCTSTDLDYDLITIEMATDSTHPYAVNDQAYEGLIKLLQREYPGLRRAYAEHFAGLFQDIQKKCDGGELSTKPLDLRGLVAAVRLMQTGLEGNRALELGLVNKSFDDFEKQLVRDVIRARLPGTLTHEDVFV